MDEIMNRIGEVYEPFKVHFLHKPVRPLAPDEVLVKVRASAICGSDLHIARGLHPSAPLPVTIGHEFSGDVVAIGSEVTKARLGERVTVEPCIVCGKCDRCRAGLTFHCASRTVMGLCGRDGCFAERFAVPVVNLVEVPRHVPDDAAVFAEPLARALHAAHILRVEGKPFVTVLGDGIDALLSAQILARLNASVRLLGWQPEKFGLCERWSIKHRHADEVGRRQDQGAGDGGRGGDPGQGGVGACHGGVSPQVL